MTLTLFLIQLPYNIDLTILIIIISMRITRILRVILQLNKIFLSPSLINFQ